MSFLRKLLKDILHSKERVNQQRGRHGIQERRDPTQERGKGNLQEGLEGRPQDSGCAPGPEDNQFRLEHSRGLQGKFLQE